MAAKTGQGAARGRVCAVAAVVSAAVGAGAAVAVSLIGSDGSGFLAFILPGAAVVGLAAGAVSFGVGALTYRVLRVAAGRWWTRVGAVIAAAISCALVVTVPFVVIPAMDGAVRVATIAACIAAVCAALAVRPLETATGVAQAA